MYILLDLEKLILQLSVTLFVFLYGDKLVAAYMYCNFRMMLLELLSRRSVATQRKW